MSLEAAFFLGVVLCVGLPAGITLGGRLRNLTALALSLSWFAGYGFYLATGEGMSGTFLWLVDVTVIAAIFAKDEWAICAPYAGLRHQLRATWWERSPWDRAVLAIFPVAWIFYVLPISPFAEYWALYYLALAQFALAGWESLHPWLRQRPMPRAETTDTSELRREGWGYV